MKKIIIFLFIAVSLHSLEWLTYEEAVNRSKKSCKPIMLVVYSSQCQACASLYKKIDASNLIKNVLEDYELSKISVNEALEKHDTSISRTPTIFLLSSNKEELLKPVEGVPMEILDFLEYLQVGIIANDNVKCKAK